MRRGYFNCAYKIGRRFETDRLTDRLGSTNAHKLMTVSSILLREFIATAIYPFLGGWGTAQKPSHLR